jgi:hypothetical protein
VTLEGTPAENEVWTIVLNGSPATTYSHTVLVDDTLTDISSGLAAQIDVGAFEAVAQGEKLIVSNPVGVVFTTSFSVTTVPASTDGGFAIRAASYAHSASLTLSEVPIAGEVWSIVLTVDGETSVFRHLVGASDTTVDIAASLAGVIQNGAPGLNGGPDQKPAPAGFVARSDGATLQVISGPGDAFTVDLRITPSGFVDINVGTTAALSGTPATGETWTLSLNDGDTTTFHSYVVQASDARSDIATALALDINTNVATGFRALADGDAVRVFNLDGDSFLVEAEIAPAATTAGFVSIVDATSTAATPKGTLEAGETWTLRLIIPSESDSTLRRYAGRSRPLHHHRPRVRVLDQLHRCASGGGRGQRELRSGRGLERDPAERYAGGWRSLGCGSRGDESRPRRRSDRHARGHRRRDRERHPSHRGR